MGLDCIFLKVDPSFAIVNRAVNELLQQKRVTVTSTNVYTLPTLKSAQKETHFSDTHNLSRRINTAIRTCICQALGYELKYIEVAIGSKEFYKFYRNNVRQSLAGDDPRMFMDNRVISVRFVAGEIDRLHPWLSIDSAIKMSCEDSYPRQVILPGMAYVFCDNFTNLIQINTTIKVDDLGPCAERGLRYSCPYMTAVCVHSNVSGDVKDGNYMLLLKAMIKDHQSMVSDKDDIVDAFGGLSLKPELDELVESIVFDKCK